MTKRQLIRYIRSLTLYILAACLFAAIGICCFTMSGSLTEECYDTWSNTKQTDPKLRREEIVRAIALQPARMEAYKLLLNEYLMDNKITRMEHEHLAQVLNQYHDNLSKNGQDAADYYRTIGFSYLTLYEEDAQQRLKAAAEFFDTAAPTPSEDSAQVLIISVYTEIFNYYAEYIWPSGYLREPSSEQIEQLLHHISAAMSTLQKTSAKDRLAFYTCVADLMTRHESLWIEKYDAQIVQATKEKILLQTQIVAKTPVEERLLQELIRWKEQNFPEEEGSESV